MDGWLIDIIDNYSEISYSNQVNVSNIIVSRILKT